MFCICGTIITLQKQATEIRCKRCDAVLQASQISTLQNELVLEKETNIELQKVKGAKIKYQCPSCKAEEMMYNTAQLRSADEGQTVFYSCDCGYKITIQS